MRRSGGFFSNKAQGHKPRGENGFINVGNEQFHAGAVALIDALYSPQRGNDAILKKILERFYHYFPRYITSQPFLTLPERMGILLNNARKSEIVECMAYVLRQITIDELCAHPLKYREVFDGFSAETVKNYLRDPKTKLPASAFNALAQALGITITLSFKEPGKELRKREIYVGEEESGSAKLDLLIQVQDDKYFPAVKHKEDFAYVGQLAVNVPKPVEDISEQEGTLEDVFKLIAQDNKELLQSYEQWRKTILSMVFADELTCEQLISLYITFLPVQSSSTSLSSTLDRLRAPVIANIPVEQEQHTKELLANAIAGWISTKQIEPDILFAQIENQSVAALR
ncbi:hypothetical protein [Legionella gratiana]|nr:hypothetical protein [Legionella gratiana]